MNTVITDELYQSFLLHFRQPGRELSALLFQYDAELVLVYWRK